MQRGRCLPVRAGMMRTGRHRRDGTLLTAPILMARLGGPVKVYGRRDTGSAARRLSRISARPLPLVLASVAFRRIHEKTGVPQDIHAHDHVISHVFAIGDRHRDIELSPRDDDSSVYDISFFRLVPCGPANTDSIEDGAEAPPPRKVPVVAGPCQARIDPGQRPRLAYPTAACD